MIVAASLVAATANTTLC